MSATTKNGIRITERGKDNGHTGAMGVDVIKLLKTQDAGYLQTVLQQTRRERERVQNEVILVSTGVDSNKATKKKLLDTDTDTDTVGQEAEDTRQESGHDDFAFSDEEEDSSEDEEAAEKGLSKEQIKQRRQKQRTRQVLESRLEALTTREKDLSAALMAVEKQKAKMNHTVGGVNKAGVKFKLRERKR